MSHPKNPQYRIQIKIDGAAGKVGPIAEKVRVLTNSAAQPEILINVTGVIRPPYRVEPTAINFGQVAPNDTAATRTVILRTNDLQRTGDFLVTKIENPAEGFLDVTFKPTANRGEFEVLFQVRKDAKPQSFQNVVVRIHTNSRIRPVTEIPLKGVIKALP